jgi:predicted HD phosphohydrolase
VYHSLQVFELSRNQMPWDEDFVPAALLHDIGNAFDPMDHLAAGIAALRGAIRPRTAFLFNHHNGCSGLQTRTLGHRARTRLRESNDFSDLTLLRDLDNAGRDVQVCQIGEALAFIRRLVEAS